MNAKSSPFFQSASILIAAFGLVAACPANGALAQDEAKHAKERLLLLERIRLASDTIFIFDHGRILREDVGRLLDDLGVKNMRFWAQNPQPFEVAGVKGVAPGYVSSDLFGRTFQYYIKSHVELAQSLKIEPEVLMSGEFESKIFNKLQSQDFFQTGFKGHRIESNDLFLADNPRINKGKKISKELLWPTFDQRTREIILQSRISVVSRYEQTTFKDYFQDELEQLQSNLIPAERDWLNALNEVSQSSKRQVVGLRYYDRLLELQVRAQTGEGKSFDTLIRPNSGSENWRPDLGLEREKLVLAGAIQLNAFPNSAAARAMPQIGLLYGERQYNWLGGNMLRILSELMGDSWNDLTAARIALYENDETEKLGWVSIVGVADSKDPVVVRRELERLSRLTSPEIAAEKNRERDQEIVRLIDDLDSSEANLANRAETRLALAGRAAKPALEVAAMSDKEVLQSAAKRILRRLNDRHVENDQKLAVSDPGFWTTLNPGLRFEKETGRIAEFSAHTIHVTPDPTKNEQEVAEAVRLMESLFGPGWQTIQVIEVGTHFVFMIGSDQEKLKRIVQRISKSVCEMSKDLAGKGNCTRDGQIQFWIHGYRFGNFVSPNSARFREKLPEEIRSDIQPIWMSIDFNGKGVEMKALATPEQIRGVAGM